MAQQLKKERFINPFFSDPKISIEELVAQQGVKPIENIDDLKGDFWPEDESVDDFIAAVRQWRDEGVAQDLPE